MAELTFEVAPVDVVRRAITIKDLYWVAGFLEGEGSFVWVKHAGAEIKASQVQREPLERLVQILGGKIYSAQHANKAKAWSPYFRWCMTGNRAVGLAFTLFSLLSTKRKNQIRAMLITWKSRRPCAKRDWNHCAKGHEFTAANTYLYKGYRNCRPCRTLRSQLFQQRRKKKGKLNAVNI